MMELQFCNRFCFRWRWCSFGSEWAGQGGVRVQRSDGGRFPLQQVLVDVVCVSLEPGGVQENVLAALLYRALGRWRVMTFKETLKAEKPPTLRFRTAACGLFSNAITIHFILILNSLSIAPSSETKQTSWLKCLLALYFLKINPTFKKTNSKNRNISKNIN